MSDQINEKRESIDECKAIISPLKTCLNLHHSQLNLSKFEKAVLRLQLVSIVDEKAYRL